LAQGHTQNVLKVHPPGFELIKGPPSIRLPPSPEACKAWLPAARCCLHRWEQTWCMCLRVDSKWGRARPAFNCQPPIAACSDAHVANGADSHPQGTSAVPHRASVPSTCSTRFTMHAQHTALPRLLWLAMTSHTNRGPISLTTRMAVNP